ncbi:MAG: dTMP kinase [Oscillospiraceae bacterium]|jgi:dTMP kinase|nr:dTMP kinase [Oscillospiraceae bacterium]
MPQGKFIVIEGIDGSGKSTQLALLEQFLTQQGIPFALHCEPTKGAMGLLLREYLSGKRTADELAIAGLFTADRLDHITAQSTGIKALLAQGINVICDRYYFSSYAYNCHSYGLDAVLLLNKACAQLLRPDLTVFIDVPVSLAMERIAQTRTEREIYENEKYLQAVRKRYFAAFERVKSEESIVIADGTYPPGEVSRIIREHLRYTIGANKK